MRASALTASSNAPPLADFASAAMHAFTIATRSSPARFAARIAAPKSLAPRRRSMRATWSAWLIGKRVENGGFHFGRQFRRLPHRANFACGTVAIALVQQHTRERQPANRAGRFPADEAAHCGPVVPFLPQPCLGAPAQQCPRPIRIGAKEGRVSLESCRAIRAPQ